MDVDQVAVLELGVLDQPGRTSTAAIACKITSSDSKISSDSM